VTVITAYRLNNW